MDVIICHSLRCSKSRQMLALLKERGIEPKVVEYLVTPPSTPELKTVLGKRERKPADILIRKEVRKAGIAADARSDDALIAAVAPHAAVIERPIAHSGDDVAPGRPPESVLDIL